MAKPANTSLPPTERIDVEIAFLFPYFDAPSLLDCARIDARFPNHWALGAWFTGLTAFTVLLMRQRIKAVPSQYTSNGLEADNERWKSFKLVSAYIPRTDTEMLYDRIESVLWEDFN